MKYFTYDLLTTINHEGLNEEKIEAAEQQWNNNSVLYAKTFQSLIDRLPFEVYDRFNGFGFHEYQLEKLALGHTSLLHTNIDLILENDNERWKLSFINISNFKFNHLNQGAINPIFNPTLDSWVQEEFLSVDDDTLSFEVLFASGANIQIYFKNNNITMEKL
ncbi:MULTISPECIES: hypothetical protein [Bacillus]|uniref:Uncharacterized protein n=2 Tax=Bacillus TaxID=1386 RepID=A0A0M4FWE8_9BACI|nr:MULTISPECIES: hypothetical protein [Bacillus]ALC83105.1 hypothetical protein AM592_17140 [Bacillus gobiensis]MBP1082160.1 hypothetical protein [Bacillus capparidis]MED1096774.1 hypothetical protein [Bacillus capparidis]